MTNEEAIEWLKVEYENVRCDECIEGEYVNALEMAIKALESSISIPSDATNGDVIKAVFPNATVYSFSYGYCVYSDEVVCPQNFMMSTSIDWWNAPYKEDKADDK